MTSKKFDEHKSAQAQINTYNDGSFALQSYETIVAEIDKDGWLQVNGLYSRTTIKHIGWFMKQLGFTYQLAKHLCKNNLRMNIHTGELVAV